MLRKKSFYTKTSNEDKKKVRQAKLEESYISTVVIRPAHRLKATADLYTWIGRVHGDCVPRSEVTGSSLSAILSPPKHHCSEERNTADWQNLQMQAKNFACNSCFPHCEPERLRRWVVNMKRDKWTPTARSHLCSLHFEEQYIDRTGQKVRLRTGAEPTIFNFPKHLQKKSTKCKPSAPRGTGDMTYSPPAVESQASQQEVQEIQQSSFGDHSYAAMESPRKVKWKFDETIAELETCKKKLKVEQQKTQCLKRKVSSLKSVIDSLHDQNQISTNCAEMLESTFSGVPKEVFQRISQPSNGSSKKSSKFNEIMWG